MMGLRSGYFDRVNEVLFGKWGQVGTVRSRLNLKQKSGLEVSFEEGSVLVRVRAMSGLVEKFRQLTVGGVYFEKEMVTRMYDGAGVVKEGRRLNGSQVVLRVGDGLKQIGESDMDMVEVEVYLKTEACPNACGGGDVVEGMVRCHCLKGSEVSGIEM